MVNAQSKNMTNLVSLVPSKYPRKPQKTHIAPVRIILFLEKSIIQQKITFMLNRQKRNQTGPLYVLKFLEIISRY